MRLKSPKWENALFGILAFFFLLHVLTSASIVFSPIVRSIFEKNTLLRYYKDYSALGPFFTVKSVRSTYYLGYTYKTTKWSEVVYPVTENHHRYLSSGSYARLKRAEFEKYLAGSVYLKENLNYRQNEAYLLEYLRKEYVHSNSIDSVHVVVLRNFYLLKKSQTDTIRNIKFQITRNE